jgi:hypothetical protein
VPKTNLEQAEKPAPEPPAKLPDSFAVSEAEEATLSRVRDSVREGLPEGGDAPIEGVDSQALRNAAKKDKKVNNLLNTVERISRQVRQSGSGEGVNQQNYIERLRQVGEGADRVLDPSIERREKAESTRF